MTGRISTHIKGQRLREYAAKLIDAGFNIRVVKALDVNQQQIPASWVVYEKDGNVGIVQYELLDSYSHSMPIEPSLSDGSAIAMFDASSELHVVHAEKTAQPENHGKFNGNKLFKNRGLRDFPDSRYELVEKDPPRLVPVRVVWQEIQQFSTVVEVQLDKGMLGSKDGRRKLREAMDEQLDLLTGEQQEEAHDESFAGNRSFISMEPIWDAVETPGTV